MVRVAAHSSVYLAVSDPTRRAILDELRRGERAAGELMTRVIPRAGQMTQPAFSQHLGVLKRAGLVRSRKSGRRRVYAVEPEPMRELAEWVGQWDVFWTEKLDNLGRYLDEQHGSPDTPASGASRALRKPRGKSNQSPQEGS